MDALAKKKEREELAAAEDAAVTTQLNKKTGVGLVNNSFFPPAHRQYSMCFLLLNRRRASYIRLIREIVKRIILNR